MLLEHSPRITGPPPTTKTKTKSVWNKDDNISLSNDTRTARKTTTTTRKTKRNFDDISTNTTVHAIRSSSKFYYKNENKNSDAHTKSTETIGRGGRHTVLRNVLHTIDVGDKYNYYDDRRHYLPHVPNVRAHSTAFDVEQPGCTVQNTTTCRLCETIHRPDIYSDSSCKHLEDQKIIAEDIAPRVLVLISSSPLKGTPFSATNTTTTSTITNTTATTITTNTTNTITSSTTSTITTSTPLNTTTTSFTDVLDNTAFNYHECDDDINKERKARSATEIETTTWMEVPHGPIGQSMYERFEDCTISQSIGNEPISSGVWERLRPRRRRGRRRRRKYQFDDDCKYLLREYNNTAWVEEEPKWSSRVEPKKENESISHPARRKKRSSGSYGALFLFYFLALPLLCSTDPSSGAVSTATFAQKSSLVYTANYTNVSNVQRFHSESKNADSQHQHQLRSTRENTTHPYNEYAWEVNQINPWLSACDLVGPAPADLQGSCGPPEVPKYCPMPCTSNGPSDKIFREVVERLGVPAKWHTGSAVTGKWRSSTIGSGNSATPPVQCLFYLEDSHKQDICRDNFGQDNPLSFLNSRENRYWFVSGLRLRHCCELAAINALAPGKGGPLEDVLNGGRRCIDALDKLLIVDALAARLHCEFQEVLARYDCAQPYSVIHNCTHCKEAYRKWVCSSLVPYFAHEGPSDLLISANAYVGTRLRPCRSFCQSVEQRCPYLLPGDRAPAYPTQYAGEPTFLCTDSNIPETGEQARRGLHGHEDEECCFRVCSDDEPASGVCANCTDLQPHGHRIGRDPPTAPQCEITAIPNQSSDSTDKHEIIPKGSMESSSPLSSNSPATTTSASSICSSGVVVSMTSSASKKNSPPASISLLCLVWIWAALMALCTGQMSFPWSPALDADFFQCGSSWLIRRRTSSTLSIKKNKCQPPMTLLTTFSQVTYQLRRFFFIGIEYAARSYAQGLWYRWWWYAWRNSSFACCQIFKWYRAKTRTKLRNIDHDFDGEDDGHSYPQNRRRNSRSTRKKARTRGRRLRRKRHKRYWFSPWKWKRFS